MSLYKVAGIRARNDAYQAMQEMPGPAAEAYCKGVRQDVATGTYEFGSPASLAGLQTPEGQAHALYCCMQRHHPDITIEDARTLMRERYVEMCQILADASGAGEPGKASAGASSTPATATT